MENTKVTAFYAAQIADTRERQRAANCVAGMTLAASVAFLIGRSTMGASDPLWTAALALGVPFLITVFGSSLGGRDRKRQDAARLAQASREDQEAKIVARLSSRQDHSDKESARRAALLA